MKYIKNKKSNVRIILIVTLFVLLLSSIIASAAIDKQTPFFSDISDTSSLLLTEEYGIQIEEEGDISSSNLRLLVTIPESIHNVQMLPPKGEAISKFNDDYNDEDNLIDRSNNSILGLSDNPNLGDSGEPSTELSFPAKIAGTYTFEFYDASSQLIGTKSYSVRGAESDTTIALQPGNYFNLRSRDISAEASYVPTLTGQKEKFLIILPPFYSFTSSIPPSTSQYTVRKISLPLPKEYYDDPDAEILKNYNPARTNVEALEFIFEAHVDQNFSLTFAFKSVNIPNLSDLMTLYGADADKIPLKLIAEGSSEDGSVQVDSAVVSGVTAITNEDGSAVIEGSKILFPNQNSVKNFNANEYNYSSANLNRPSRPQRSAQIANWHYPVTKTGMYIPYPEIMTSHGFATANSQIIYLDGQRYIHYKWSPEQASFKNISDGASNDVSMNMSLPHTDALTGGQVIPLGDVFYDYTYMGQDYTMQKVFTASDLVIPDYTQGLNWTLTFQNPANSVDFRPIFTDRAQGKSDDVYRFAIHNSSPTLLSPSYENTSLYMEFPYETSPTSIKYTLGHNNIGNREDDPPKALEFLVHGDPVPRTVALPQLPNSGNDIVFPLPIAAGEHVTRLSFQFDILPSTSHYEFYVTASNARQDENGVDLPTVIDRTLKFGFEGTRVEGRLSDDPIRTSVSESLPANYKLIYTPPVEPPVSDKKDSLYFGRNYGNTYDSKLDIAVTNPTNISFGNMFFAFKKSTVEMKDYENVVVTFDAVTEADKAALSLVTGLNAKNMLPGKVASKNDVYYKTNFNDEWRLATKNTGSDRTTHLFILEDDEYTTSAKIELGTIYGESMVYQAHNTNDNMANGTVSVNASGTIHAGVFPTIRNQRAVFKGDPDKERNILVGERFDLKATITLDGPAQHIINDQNASSLFNNDTGKGGIIFNHYSSTNVYRDTFTNYIYANGQSHYQGQSFGFHHYTNGYVPTYNGTHFRFYYEVYDYFEMTDLLYVNTNKATLVETKKLPERGTTLYVYDVLSNSKEYYVKGQYYVRPDAPVGSLPIIKASGVAIMNFKNQYMTPETGDDAYFNSPPYTKYSIIGQRPFPTEWGDNLGTDGQYLMTAGDRGSISVQRTTLNMISMVPKVNGAKSESPAPFFDHQKSSMQIDAYMGNGSPGVIPYYEALYTIPKAGSTTTTVNEQGGTDILTNEFDLYLKKPISANSALVNPVITYYTNYTSGSTITINESSSESDLKSVTAFTLSFENFPPFTTYPISFELGTNTTKYGSDVAPKLSFIGAASRNSSTGAFVHSQAVGYEFRSYTLSFRIGRDTNEVGRLDTVLGNIATAKVYYLDNGVSTELGSYTDSSNTVLVNTDVEKITIEPTEPDKYMLTKPNFYSNRNEDSDYPRVESSEVSTLLITSEDLASQRLNYLDAAFIIKPTLPIKDFTVGNNLATSRGISLAQLVDFRLTTTNVVIPARGYYKQTISNIADSDLVDITINNSDKKLYALGKSLGSTSFTYTLTNRLGDEFVVDNVKVDIVRSFVTKATIRKGFTNADVNLDNDTFDFYIWNEGTATSPIGENLVSGINEKTDTVVPNIIEKGIKHYIREVARNGYNNDGYKGTADNANISFTDEDNGIYSFVVPVTAKNVNITPYNKNASTDLILRQEMDAAAIAHNPNQAFEITITEKGKVVPEVNVTLKSGESKPVSGLTFGRTYVVKETPVTDFALEKVTIEKAGAAVGTQPSLESENSYEFTLGLAHEGTEIIVYNQLAKGKGLELYKHVDMDTSLPKEAYEFTLTLPDGSTYYGLVPESEIVFPAKVKWYEDSTSTVTELDLTTLKTGEYKLTEDTGPNYELDEFKVVSGSALASSTKTQVLFHVTSSSELITVEAHNKPKEGGQVNIAKLVDNRYLEDTMEFTITHKGTDRKFVSEEKVTSNNFMFSSWKENGLAIGANQLPFGEYSLTETLEGEHYAFEKFHPTAGIVIDPTDKTATFTLSSTFDTANITAENKLFEKGELKISSVPNLDYGSVPIGSTIDVLKRTENVYIEVENTLRLQSNWSLKVRADDQVATIDGNVVTFPYQLLKYSKDGLNYDSLSYQQTIMDQSESKVGNIHRQDWLADDSTGIIANVWFHPDSKAGGYSSTVTWSLEFTP